MNKPEPRFESEQAESEQEEDVCAAHVFFTNDNHCGLKACDRGLDMTEILPNGPLNRHNCAGQVRAGDILEEVNGKVVGGMNSVKGLLALDGL